MFIRHDMEQFIEDYLEGNEPTTEQVLNITRAIDYDLMADKQYGIYSRIWKIYEKGTYELTFNAQRTAGRIYRTAIRHRNEYQRLSSIARQYWEKI